MQLRPLRRAPGAALCLTVLVALAPACSSLLGIDPLPGLDGGAGDGSVAPGPDGTILGPDGEILGPDGAVLGDSASPGDGSPPGETGVAPDGACAFQDSTDHDGDGFSYADGDCNDCDPNFNPGAYDYVDGLDQDCDGKVDDEPVLCDTGVALASIDGLDGARSLGLCRQTTETAQGKARTWGVISAQYVSCDGTDDCGSVASGCSSKPNFALGHGNLSHLGTNEPLEGAHMLALSSGTARDPTDPGYQNVSGFDKGFACTLPTGYPVAIPSCPGVTTSMAHDCVALQIVLRAPTNAASFQISENFFTYEFPTYVCSEYNDYFVALMTPAPQGVANGNIAFDAQGNPINVDSNLLQVCDAQTAGGKTYTCAKGPTALANTGFGASGSVDAGTDVPDHAATGWLRTTVPSAASKGQDITLRFSVWDSGDGILDSTTLLDAFIWSPATVAAVSTVAE